MIAIRFRAGVWLRRQIRPIALTAVVIGLVGGIAMSIVAGTRLTSSAPDRYTRQFGGDPDLYITLQAGPPLRDSVAGMAGVKSIQSISFVLAFPLAPDDGSPLTDLNPFAGNDDAVGARVVEGRFTNPEAGDEFTVNGSLIAKWRERFGTKVGDSFTFAGFSFEQLRSDLDLTTTAPEVPPFSATLVGVTESPSDFDETSDQLVFSKGLFRDHADVGVVQTLIAAHLEAGATAGSVLERVRELPGASDAYSLPIRIVSDSARRAVRFQTVALWLVSALTIVATALVAALVAGRALRVTDDERTSVQALGWTRRDLATERAIEGAVIGLVAAPIALGLAYAGTAVFPLGALKKLDPGSGPRADWLVLSLGALALVLLTAGAGAYVGNRTRVVRTRRATAARLRSGSMPLSVGVHFATVNRRGSRTWASAIAGAAGVAGLLGAAVVGVSLTSIVAHGDRWGIDYDALYGDPYSAADRDIVGPIVGLPHVAAVTGGTIGSLSVDGSDVATFAFAPAKGDLHPTVIEGRSPAGEREIGLGAEVTKRLGVDLGDSVRVGGSAGETRDLQVVGIVVTPDSAGNGAAIPFDTYASLNPDSSQNIVMIDFDADAPASAIDTVSKAVYSPPDALETPTTIRALERVAAAPFLLCVVFAAMILVGGAYLIGASVRSRNRDFALLRAMGAVRGQRRAVVRWQASATATVMTLVGIPIGILLGRRVVESIVSSLGIVPGVDVPAWLLAAAVLAALFVANLIALVPAQRAASPAPVQL